MSGASLGVVTALALSAAATPAVGPAAHEVHFGARPVAPPPRALVQPTPALDETEGPKIVCTMRVIHVDPRQVDGRFVIPVPRQPTFTMRWAPAAPCDQTSAAQSEDATGPRAKPDVAPKR